MSGFYVVIHPTTFDAAPRVSVVPVLVGDDIGLETLYSEIVIDGSPRPVVEAINLRIGDLDATMWVDEEGALKPSPALNVWASMVAWRYRRDSDSDVVRFLDGIAVVTGSDGEDTVGLCAEDASAVVAAVLSDMQVSMEHLEHSMELEVTDEA